MIISKKKTAAKSLATVVAGVAPMLGTVVSADQVTALDFVNQFYADQGRNFTGESIPVDQIADKLIDSFEASLAESELSDADKDLARDILASDLTKASEGDEISLEAKNFVESLSDVVVTSEIATTAEEVSTRLTETPTITVKDVEAANAPTITVKDVESAEAEQSVQPSAEEPVEEPSTSPLDIVEGLDTNENELPDVETETQAQKVYTTKKAVESGEGTYYYDKSLVRGTVVELEESEAKSKGLSHSLLEASKEDEQSEETPAQEETTTETKELDESNTAVFINREDWNQQGGTYSYTKDGLNDPATVREADAINRGFITTDETPTENKTEYTKDENAQIGTRGSAESTGEVTDGEVQAAGVNSLPTAKSENTTKESASDTSTGLYGTTDPAASTTEKGQSSLPTTGDSSAIATSMAGVAMLGLAATFAKRRKEEK